MAKYPRSKYGIEGRRLANEALMCKACQLRHREGFSPTCARCAARRAKFGHPKGRIIPQAFYKNETREAAAFIKKWQSSVQIVAGIKWFEDRIESACSGRCKDITSRIFANFGDHNVHGRELLVHLLSGWLHVSRFPTCTNNLLPFNLVCFILRACGAERTGKAGYQYNGRTVYHYHHPGRPERKAVGDLLFHTFKYLFEAMNDRMEADEKIRNDFISKTGLPFDPDAEYRRKKHAQYVSWRDRKNAALDAGVEFVPLKAGRKPWKHKEPCDE